MDDERSNDATHIRTEEFSETAAPLSGPLTGVNICVIGAGFVGCVTAAGLAKFGHNVVCVEKDADKLAMLKEGRLPFFERDLEELIKSNVKSGRLSFSSDLENSLAGQKAAFIAVGTPSDDSGRADLSAIYGIVDNLGKVLKPGQVVVIRSTVPIGTAAELKQILKRNGCENGEIAIISNPEFLREGTAVYDFFNPHRIVIGGDSSEAIDTIQHIYRMGAVKPSPTIVTNNETAEMIKYASNAFLATKIGFINELAMLCDNVGIDVLEVARAMGMDSRIGSEFLNPGPGWGGSCLPKDLQEFTGLGNSRGIPLLILEAVKKANIIQHDFVVSKIKDLTTDIEKKRIGILGLSFKAETSDLRDSPAMAIARKLLDNGFIVKAYDPAAGVDAKRQLPDLDVTETSYDALDGVDCAVILTEWSEFQLFDWKKAGEIMRHKKIVDARNILSPELIRRYGFEYRSIGQI
ncbi:MAG: UDP-glucose/GDP-mannose dehydrogenase family protein [candidate division Zixibacteria bacterium]